MPRPFESRASVSARSSPASLLHPTRRHARRRSSHRSSLRSLVLVLVCVVGWWLLGASLRPVVRMTRQAASWSEHDLDHRFALGPPHDELTELAATLDGLLDQIATSLRHERRFSAELSHELRTPLARVLAQCEFALRRRREPEQYEETIELIQGNARATGPHRRRARRRRPLRGRRCSRHR